MLWNYGMMKIINGWMIYVTKKYIPKNVTKMYPMLW